MASRRATALSALAAIAAAVTALTPAGARAATLGTIGSAEPSCPADCLVEARVTAFQTSIGDRRKLFRTAAQGRIVSWSIDLGMPDLAERKGFNRRFGESKARLSILKKVRRGNSHRAVYILLRESKVQGLRSHFGQTATFSLERPLKVGPGQIVALTIPTWAPAFAVDESGSSRWLSSRRATRRRGGCMTDQGFANIAAGSPHQRLGTGRAYRCSYQGSRLLYSASFVGTEAGARR